MDISFTTWRAVVDLFEHKKTPVTLDDFKMFRLIQESKEFYIAITESADPLSINIGLSSQYMDQNYISNEQRAKVERGFFIYLGKTVAFQFCLYSY